MPLVVKSPSLSLAVFFIVGAVCTSTLSVRAGAQAAPSPSEIASPGLGPSAAADSSAMVDALNAMAPTLSGVNLAVSGVEVRRWKVPGEVKETTTSDIQSIQRDLSGTLPSLISQAQAAPGAVAPAFAVFRNLDALYDVLLRVTETATLAGSQQEASHLEAARADLQTRRGQLGNALQAIAAGQDTSVVQLRTALETARRSTLSNPAAPKKIVVNDGPDNAPAKTVHKKKPLAPAAKPATPPAASPGSQQ